MSLNTERLKVIKLEVHVARTTPCTRQTRRALLYRLYGMNMYICLRPVGMHRNTQDVGMHIILKLTMINITIHVYKMNTNT
jgi:hypothetical protein